MKKIAQLLQTNASDEMLAQEMVQVVNRRFFDKEIPEPITKAAKGTLQNLGESIFPWKYIQARKRNIAMFGIPWHKLPTPLALLQLLQFRNKLREENLHDTSQVPNKNELPKPVSSPDGQHLRVRTTDGSFNDLDRPEMGMAGTRLGRNIPLTDGKRD